MQTTEREVREPWLHITKRRAPIIWWKAWLIRLLAVVAALAVCSVLIVVMTGINPLEMYATMFKGSFSTSRKFWVLLQKTAMLLCIALAVTPAFKMRFWNLGAEGQVLAGGLACVACLFYIKTLPSWALILIMLVCSILGGMLWSLLPGWFKAAWNTNETLFTLMMNYVAIQLVSFCIAVWVPSGSGTLPILNSNTRLGWLPFLGGNQYLINILVVAAVTVAMFVYLRYSKHGYEIAVVGESQNTARYSGINVKKVIVRTALLSGGLCGLCGFLLVAGGGHTISTGLAGGNGFTAVLVSWLSKFNPIVMVFTSAMIVFLQRGAAEIATAFRLDDSISDIVTGIILIFIIGSEFFIQYQLHFRKSRKEAQK